jgi:hypothetical protein
MKDGNPSERAFSIKDFGLILPIKVSPVYGSTEIGEVDMFVRFIDFHADCLSMKMSAVDFPT